MNEKVTQMVALLFKDIQPSEEVQALQEEVLNNCQERFADLVRSGLSEEECLAAVMESLKGMDEVLSDYPRKGDATAEEIPGEAAEKAPEEKHEPSLQSFEPEDIRAIDAQLTNCDVEILLSEEGFTLEKQGDVNMELEKDGTLRLWQDPVTDNLLKGISWEESFDSFEHFGDALNKLGQNISHLFSRGFQRYAGTEDNRVVLRLPDSVHPDVRLRTTSGDLTWTGPAPGGEMILRSTSGDITVRVDEAFLLPSVQVSTMSGDAELDLNAEEVRISSVSGDVTWNGTARLLEMNSTSGDAEACGRIEETRMNTTSGDLSLELLEAERADIRLNSVSGNLDLRLPSSVQAIRADLKTVSGEIRNRGVGMAEDAPVHVQANTVSGDLRIYN